MPLLDHFHPPLYPAEPWESFHLAWCSALMRQLNQALRPRYRAASHLHLGTDVEADIAELDTGQDATGGNGQGGTALATWTEVATQMFPAVFPDDIEVQVLDTRDGATVVAVVELVSPGNKDRPEAREAFASKCVAYLQRGIGVLVIDIVTSRLSNLHDELVGLMRLPEGHRMNTDSPYAAAYRPVVRQKKGLVDAWLFPLAVTGALPPVPLWLRGNGCFVLDLEASYARAREDSGF